MLRRAYTDGAVLTPKEIEVLQDYEELLAAEEVANRLLGRWTSSGFIQARAREKLRAYRVEKRKLKQQEKGRSHG